MDEFQHVYQTKRITFTLKNDLQVLIPHEDLVWNRQDEETMRTTSQVGWFPPTHLRLIPLSPLLGLLANVLRSFVHWFCVSKTECCLLTV